MAENDEIIYLPTRFNIWTRKLGPPSLVAETFRPVFVPDEEEIDSRLLSPQSPFCTIFHLLLPEEYVMGVEGILIPNKKRLKELDRYRSVIFPLPQTPDFGHFILSGLIHQHPSFFPAEEVATKLIDVTYLKGANQEEYPFLTNVPVYEVIHLTSKQEEEELNY